MRGALGWYTHVLTRGHALRDSIQHGAAARICARYSGRLVHSMNYAAAGRSKLVGTVVDHGANMPREGARSPSPVHVKNGGRANRGSGKELSNCSRLSVNERRLPRARPRAAAMLPCSVRERGTG